MEKELAKLIKTTDSEAAYLLGLFYENIKISNRLSTFYGLDEHLLYLNNKVKFYTTRQGDGYVCKESLQLSDWLINNLKYIVSNWKNQSQVFIDNFTKGYLEANLRELKLGNYSFKYLKGKKRILKTLQKAYLDSYLVKMSKDYILYIPENTPLIYINKFDTLFNISKADQYRAIIGLILGDGHLKKYDYIQITHTDKQESYIRFLKLILDYWGIKNTIGNTSVTKKIRKDGSNIINHYFYIKLDNDRYFKNRVSLTNKQVNSYLASRLTPLGLLFWYLDDGSYTTCGINLHTNGFDKLSQNVLKKYLNKIYKINPKVYKDLKQNNYLHFSVKDSNEYLRLISDYICFLPKCFANKFSSFDNSLCII